MDTPGRKLILGLLAKSVAKINAADSNHCIEAQSKTSLKRKNLDVEPMNKKIKKCKQKELPGLSSFLSEYIKPHIIKADVKTEYLEIKSESFEEKTERNLLKGEITKTKIENIKLKTENTDIKSKGQKIKHEYKEMDMKNENLNVHNVKTDDQLYIPDSSGRALILNLLAKSVAKLNTVELENKHFSNDNIKCSKKKKCKQTEIKIQKQIEHFETNPEVETDTIKIELKTMKNEKNNEPKTTEIKMVTTHQPPARTTSSNVKALNTKLCKSRKSGIKHKKFTPDEDKILQSAIETYGDQISVSKLTKVMNRKSNSIGNRIEKLKIGKSGIEHRAYTLLEDFVILDAVLKELPGKNLEKLDLPSFNEWKVVGNQIGRQDRHVKYRWEYHLKSWLLQHFSGTLNLDVKRMLANYLADHFEDIDCVDWPEVAGREEFAGHTQNSLKYIFFTFLFKRTKDELDESGEKITLKQIANVSNKYFKDCRGRQVREKTIRQKEVISYFKKQVGQNVRFTLK